MRKKDTKTEKERNIARIHINTLKRQSHKMVEHTQIIRRLLRTKALTLFECV